MYHKEILITLNNYKKRPLTNGLNFLRLEVEELVLGQRVHGHGGVVAWWRATGRTAALFSMMKGHWPARRREAAAASDKWERSTFLSNFVFSCYVPCFVFVVV